MGSYSSFQERVLVEQFKTFLCLIFSSNTEAKDTTLNDEKSFAVAKRMSDFEYSEESVKNNIFVFEGAENPFVMSRVYDVNWICEYDMR